MRTDHPVLDPGILHGLHLIEADAGTGKTWTLSGLVVRALVERALDIDRILVVTFTRAATAELIGRIRARIDQLRIALTGEVASDDPFIAEYLRRIDDPAAALARVRRALACMDDAAVHTIHGFCQRVLAEHAMSTGVPLQTTLTAGDDELLLRVIGDWWRAQVIDGPAGLVAFCSWHRLSPVSVLPIVRRALQTPALEIRPRVDDWRARLTLPRAAIERLEPLWREQREALRAWLGVKTNVNGNSFRPASVARWFDEIDTWLGSSRVLGDCDPEGARKLSREHFEQRNKGRLPPGDLAQAFADVVEAYRLRDECVAALLADVIDHVRRDLPAARDASGVLEFDDLLLRMRDALADPLHGGRFATLLQERYPLALIDECQDTDPLQWEVFRRVHFGGALSAAGPGREAGNAGAHGLIVVGDPKQSIYGFRGADVFSYLDARAQGGRQHRLTENQRSDPALITAINALFGRERPFLVDEIGFDEATAADRRRACFEDAGGVGRAPMNLVAIGARDNGPAGSSASESGSDGSGGDGSGDDGSGNDGSGNHGSGNHGSGNHGSGNHGCGADGAGKSKAMTVEQASALAARACAREIARLLGPGGARIDGRALRPSDVAVLVHRHAEGAAIKRALARLGIGAVELSRDSVFASRQADELLRVIGALAQPARTDLLRGALVTRLLGWDAGDLAGDLAGDAEGEDRLAGAARAFAQAREHWFDAGPMAALRALVHRWNGFARLAGDEDGERVLTNVLHLLELLAGAQQARTGPQAALRWLSRCIERGDAGEAGELRLESDARLVNVVTIHRSKGLEYPVVVLPFAWTGRPHRRPSKPDSGILWHEHTGGEWRSVRGFGIPSGDAADSRAALEHHSETLRQLYVAVTRARHRCYLFWGAASDSVRAPLAWLLHGIDPLDKAAAKSLSPEVVMPTLQAFAAPLPEACCGARGGDAGARACGRRRLRGRVARTRRRRRRTRPCRAQLWRGNPGAMAEAQLLVAAAERAHRRRPSRSRRGCRAGTRLVRAVVRVDRAVVRVAARRLSCRIVPPCRRCRRPTPWTRSASPSPRDRRPATACTRSSSTAISARASIPGACARHCWRAASSTWTPSRSRTGCRRCWRARCRRREASG